MFPWVGGAGVSGTREQNSALQLALSCRSRSIKGMPLPPALCINVLIVRTPAGTFSGGLLEFPRIFKHSLQVLGRCPTVRGDKQGKTRQFPYEEGRETRGSLFVVGFFHGMPYSADFCVVQTRCSARQLPLACSPRFSSRGKGSAAGSGQGKRAS